MVFCLIDSFLTMENNPNHGKDDVVDDDIIDVYKLEEQHPLDESVSSTHLQGTTQSFLDEHDLIEINDPTSQFQIICATTWQFWFCILHVGTMIFE